MPYIRITSNTGKAGKATEWMPISDVSISDDGYLQMFTITKNDTIYHVHLVRHDPIFWSGLGVAIFNGATSLRSAKGLLEEFRKDAGKIGIALGSAALISSWMKNKPYRDEGYYNFDGKKMLDRVINTKNTQDYAS